MNIINIGCGNDVFPKEIFEYYTKSRSNLNSVNNLICIDKNIDKNEQELLEKNNMSFNLHFYKGNFIEVIHSANFYKFKEQCDLAIAYRVMEHIPRKEIDFALYSIWKTLKPEGILDIIVPNFINLAKFILQEDEIFSNNKFSEIVKYDILVSTEIYNEPSDPHQSIWTPTRAKIYIETEGLFKIHSIKEKYVIDNRDIYMRVISRKVSKGGI